MQTTDPPPAVLIRVESHVGHITLNRPQALNALSHAMVIEILAALQAWKDDSEIAFVLIDATGERAFCAGGDVASIYRGATTGADGFDRAFFADEYQMNALIALYPKPVVAFMQGFTMGGGVGLGCHAKIRVICETTQMAMPETQIGLIPDVGGTLLLARAPGRMGDYLGLTGARMGPGDAVAMGFADICVPFAMWPELIARIIKTGDLGLITAAAHAAPDATMRDIAPKALQFLSGETVQADMKAMAKSEDAFATAMMKTLAHMSPLSLAATKLVIDRARVTNTIQSALQQEFRFTARALALTDFAEGVRAALIDKDRNPAWKHADVHGVTEDEVDALMGPLAQGDLWTIREDVE